jgi:hypothetical protein
MKRHGGEVGTVLPWQVAADVETEALTARRTQNGHAA